MYVNLKKRIEISHLRGKYNNVYSQVMYLFYNNTASCRRILSAENLNNRIFFSDLLIQLIATQGIL